MNECEREGCHDLKDHESPLALCRKHQAMFDAKNLGWDKEHREGRDNSWQ